MISYAQNGEDIVLARLFDGDAGFYVDIGAWLPDLDSVTKHFYDRGWRGLNVEPMAVEYALLETDRPRDINVRVAVSDHIGEAVLFEAPLEKRGLSTLEPEVAAAYREAGDALAPVTVPTTTLTALLDEHDIDAIDFIKIDVEGHEHAIITSTDWKRIRPRVLVVEATIPNSPVPSHESWEGILTGAGYVCTLFDGLNRFYVQSDDAEALEKLSTPANVFDQAQPWALVKQIVELRTHLGSLGQEHETQLRDVHENHVAEVTALHEETSALRAELATRLSADQVAALHEEISTLRAELATRPSAELLAEIREVASEVERMLGEHPS